MNEPQSFVSEIKYNGDLSLYNKFYESYSAKFLKEKVFPKCNIEMTSGVIMKFNISDEGFELIKAQKETIFDKNPYFGTAVVIKPSQDTTEVKFYLSDEPEEEFEVSLTDNEKDYFIDRANKFLQIQEGKSLEDFPLRKIEFEQKVQTITSR